MLDIERPSTCSSRTSNKDMQAEESKDADDKIKGLDLETSTIETTEQSSTDESMESDGEDKNAKDKGNE